MDRSAYHDLYDQFLVDCARRVEEFIGRVLADTKVDRITARAKNPERFFEKASRTDSCGNPKYIAPLIEIQDLVGVRVVVLFLEDVEPVRKKLSGWVRSIEDRSLSPKADREFSYFGYHSVMFIPDECRVEFAGADEIKFFELQIKTVFQHAWSEAEHDLVYKPMEGPLSAEQKRLTGFAASLAWGADKAFQDVLDATRLTGKR
ncbi:GTP pyrophosphokinase [Neotabrizicola shimadae]|nr:RelA/SpoT domain-containing protein [Neotabrizicola shimadae]